MESKDVRNVIISLIIIIVGIYFMMNIAQAYMTPFIDAYNVLPDQSVTSLSSFGVLISMALGGLVLLLIPVWLWARSSEKKADKTHKKIENHRENALARERQLAQERSSESSRIAQLANQQRQREYQQSISQKRQNQEQVKSQPIHDNSAHLRQHRFNRAASSSNPRSLDVADEYAERIRKKRRF